MAVVSLLVVATASHSQQVEPPVFKDGDWWKLKVEGSTEILQRSGFCFEMYGEYIVKIVGGNRKVFVGEKEIDCGTLSARLLGAREERDRLYIPLPLKLGEEKSFRTTEHPFETITVTLKAQKRATFSGKELTVYEIHRTTNPLKGNVYFDDTLLYSPECKCVALFDRVRKNDKTGVRVAQKQVVIEFSVAP
jgi:hypothetical protein